MINLTYTYDSITKFYQDALNPTPEGNVQDTLQHLMREEESFRGMDIANIKKNQYGYKEGLDRLEKLNLNLSLGGSKRDYKWDELDGDDMNYDRLMEGFPAMKKRIKTHGVGSGRLINLYVVISENCNIDSEEMLNKAYTAMQIVDLLENLGYRVAVYSCDSTLDSNGTYKGESNVRYEVYVCLKRHEDSLNRGLILNGISPWFFRYYMFAHQKGRYKNGWGMGRSVPLNIKQTKENIVINHGECLNKDSANIKIKKIRELFKVDQETLCHKEQLCLNPAQWCTKIGVSPMIRQFTLRFERNQL